MYRRNTYRSRLLGKFQRSKESLSRFTGCCSSVQEENDISLWDFLPALLLFLFSLLGGLIFSELGLSRDCNAAHQNATGYWTSLFFVNTVYTTIGYGNVVPCTRGGRLMVMFYALFGIPLALIVLNNLGEILASIINRLWAGILLHGAGCHCSKNKDAEKGKDVETLRAMEYRGVPAWLGLMIVIWWILAAAAFFAATEEWAYFEALYFTFVSFATIGFGDYYPSKTQLTIFSFVFIIIGLSLFSLFIKLVQHSVESIYDKITYRILTQYKESLVNGSSEDFQKILRKEAGLQRFLLARKHKQNLSDWYSRILSMTSDATQTFLDIGTVGVQTQVLTAAAGSQTGAQETASKATNVTLEDLGYVLERKDTSELDDFEFLDELYEDELKSPEEKRKWKKKRKPMFKLVFPSDMEFSKQGSLYQTELEGKLIQIKSQSGSGSQESN